MKKPLLIFVVVLLAGAGWFALHRANEGGPHRRPPFDAPVEVATGVGANAAPSAPQAPTMGTTAPQASPSPPLPLAFEYADAQPAPDGSFAVRWDFGATARLHPGEAVRVRLPFAAEPYTAIVQEASSIEGTRRTSGRLQDDRGVDSWPFSMTLSTDGRYVTANFQTGAAQFSVEADPRGGRLKDAATEAARLDNDAQ